MTTPSPQPQPDGDWATKAAEEVIVDIHNVLRDEGVYIDLDDYQDDIAELIRRHDRIRIAPAPAPTANEGADDSLPKRVRDLEGLLRMVRHELVELGASETDSDSVVHDIDSALKGGSR
jgi:hypothetical protein